MAFASITSASATIRLTVDLVYPNGVDLNGFGVDDAFVADTVDAAEIQVGVDSYGAAGYRPRPVPMSIRFLASSSSTVVFENWLAAEDQLAEKLGASAIILMPTVRRKYVCQNGVLMRVSTMAEVRRVLANREWQIVWLPGGPGNPAVSAAPM